MRRSLQRDRHLRILTRTRHIVGHTDRDFKLVAGRNGEWRVRRKYEISLHDGLAAKRADGGFTHCHSH